MLIRKNTKAFKTILEIVTALRDRPDRDKLIRLYITKAGDTIAERISIEGAGGESALFYEMNYQAVLGNLQSSSHQLHQSEDTPGIYFFHSSSNKVWDETPFEFDDAISKEFGSLHDPPTTRKKEKSEKSTLTVMKVAGAAGKGKGRTTLGPEKKAKSDGRPKPEKEKSGRVVAMWPKQPDYNLKRDIHFTGLERLAFRQRQLTRKDVLDYYNGMADHLLPWLKDRPLIVRLQRDGHPGPPSRTMESLKHHIAEEIPDWLGTETVGKGKTQEQWLLCNDSEHLLFYVQAGCLEFRAGHSRKKSPDSPDYIAIAIEAQDEDPAKAIAVALSAKTVLDGLRLPSFVKTDGVSGLQIYIPLDAKTDFPICRHVSEYLCKLVRLKIPDRVVLEGSGERDYGKVLLRYQLNDPDQGLIAPYSLAFPNANVATPLSWDEVEDGLTFDAFDPERIAARLKKGIDPFAGFFRKKVNAREVGKRLEEYYSFLV